MRTTLTIDDDVLQLARALSQQRSVSIGEAISELARRGYQASVAKKRANGFTVFDVPAGTPRFGLDQVRDADETADTNKYGEQMG